MSKKSTDNEMAGPVVVLVDREGRECAVTSAALVSQLHYGNGYTFKDDLTFHQAVEHLGGEAAVDNVPTVETPSRESKLSKESSESHG